MRKVGFDREFEYKDLPDETTPDNSENANKSIHNTWYLLQQLENLIDSKTGSNIEITECAEAMLNKLEIEGKSIQESEPSPDNPSEIKCVGKVNGQGKYEIELTISKDDESKTTTIVLNEPLRGLSNGTKDLLYIRGGRLFVQRNVGSITIDDSYSFGGLSVFEDRVTCFLNILVAKNIKLFSNALSNCYKYNNSASSTLNKLGQFSINSTLNITFPPEINDISKIKNYIASLKPIIVYELNEPFIEDLGEIAMPITFKDKSTITTTDELEPTINLEYVKDTILTDYIEKRLINLIK